MSTSVSKIVAQRNHRTLLELVLKPGNDVCADCKARAPRWASYNLGIFICVSCASIHRKIGTHITKVKSLTLDEWTKEQVEVMKEKGNVRSNALYNPDEARHPPPTNMIDSERDSELEIFIRSKYEFKRFMNQRSGTRSQSTPRTNSPQIERKTSPAPPLPPKTPENLPSSLRALATAPSHDVPPAWSSRPLPPLTDPDKLTAVPPLRRPAAIQLSLPNPSGEVWEDLISLQEPSKSSSLPLQYSPVSPVMAFPSQPQVPVQQQPTMLGNAPNPFTSLSFNPVNATTPVVANPISTLAPGARLPFASSALVTSPALHLSATNPFNQVPAVSAAGVAFPTSSNPFSSSPVPMSLAMATAALPSAQPVMALPTEDSLHTPPLPYVTSQTPTPAPALPSTPTSFTTAPALVQNLSAPVSIPGHTSLSTAVTNPFSTMQMEQARYSGGTPQTTFGTTAFLSYQQQPGPDGLGGWAGQRAQGSF